MTSPGTLHPPSACRTQSVATPLARREAHAVKGWQDSLLGSLGGACEPAGPTTSCAGSRHGAALEPTCSQEAGPHPAPQHSSQHACAASEGWLTRTPLPATPPAAAPLPATPRSRVLRFGSPLGSPMPAELLAGCTASGFQAGPGQQTAGACAVSRVPASPRCSALLQAGFIPAPPLVAMTPQLLSALRPCSVRLAGSVRLRGGEVERLPRRQLSLSLSSAAAQAAPCAAREPSFADLLSLPSAPAAVSDGASAHLPAPLALAGPPASLSAQMALSPRKRARKCAAPLRAAAGEGELPGAMLESGSEQADSEELASALAHRTPPRKAPRCR